MGILDLSLVTESLIYLLTCYFSNASENKVANLSVSSRRPDQLKDNAVGLYLYHVCEDPHYKNLPTPADLAAPVKFSPLGLQLFYQLVTQYAPNSEDIKTAIFEQQMMGIAMKALHDYPIINDETTIYDPITAKEETVFVGTLKGTGSRLRIELLNIDQKDAMSYWGTSHAAPRLAA